MATIIADSSKFQRTALFEVCPLKGFHRLVTETRPPAPLADALDKAGVEVVIPSNPI